MAVSQFTTSPDSLGLGLCKQKYLTCRKFWESSEAFDFGPSITLLIDESIDTWPLDTNNLKKVLADNSPLDESTIENFDPNFKGFHAIEYLLFGIGGAKQIGQFTSRDLAYLKALTENLKVETGILLNAWQSNGQNFGGLWSNAGVGNSLYSSQNSAIQEVTNACLDLLDELPNQKIDNPLKQNDPALEEAFFSNNTKNEYLYNVRSLLNVYYGSLDMSAGNGLQTIIQARNPNTHVLFNQQLLEAYSAAQNIPNDFTYALFHDKSSIETAKAKLVTAYTTYKNQIAPILLGL
jgi:predicted lipoprotein